MCDIKRDAAAAPRRGEKITDNGKKRRHAMGDKGKKDKEKGRKQKKTKREQKSKRKLDKQQRKIL